MLHNKLKCIQMYLTSLASSFNKVRKPSGTAKAGDASAEDLLPPPSSSEAEE